VEGGILVEVDATVGEFSEGSLLFDFGGLLGVVFVLLGGVYISYHSSKFPNAPTSPLLEDVCHVRMFADEGMERT
jgi:hypothetical protein